MTTIRRLIADALENFVGARIVRTGQIGPLFEEEHIKRFFERFAIDCVFDVGANAGQYAGMLRKRVGYRGPIVSFEPIPELAKELRAKGRADGNWFIEEVALGRLVRSTSFNVMATKEFSSLRAPTDLGLAKFDKMISIQTKIAITTSTLSIQFAKWKQEIGFERPYLKLDTQGNDTAIVEGAGDTITEFVGLQSELAVRRLYSQIPDFHEAIHFYEALGFDLSAFVPNNAGHFPILIETDCIMINRRYLPSRLRNSLGQHRPE